MLTFFALIIAALILLIADDPASYAIPVVMVLTAILLNPYVARLDQMGREAMQKRLERQRLIEAYRQTFNPARRWRWRTPPQPTEKG